MKEDGDAVVLEVAKTTSGALDDLDLAVEPFSAGVGDAVLDVGHKSPFIVRRLALAPRRCITDGTLRLGPKSSLRIASTVAAKQ